MFAALKKGATAPCLLWKGIILDFP